MSHSELTIKNVVIMKHESEATSGTSHVAPPGGKRCIRRRRRRGLSTVEMAMVLTLLLYFLLGIIEYGWLLLKYQEVTGATRQGTRVGAPFHRENQDIRNAINASMISAGLGDSDYQVCIGTPTSPCSGGTDSLPNIMELNPGELFEVRVTLPYRDGVSLGMPLIPRPENVWSRLTMVREGI